MSTSPTLRVLAHAVNGLYFDERTGQRYRRDELLEAFPASVLDSQAHLARLADGVYSLEVTSSVAPSFRLQSRRRRPREDREAEIGRGDS